MKKISFIAVILSLSALPALRAEGRALVLSPESRIYLTGQSTLHPYASTSTLTRVTALLASGNGAEIQEPAQAILTGIARRPAFEKYEVIVPVKGLKSGESGLDKNMYKALKAESAPEVLFALTSYEAVSESADAGISFKAAGVLSIAGQSRDVVLTGAARPGAEGLAVDGEYALRMSDYGVKPPSLLMGAIKVADPVVVHFHLHFQLTKGALQ